MCDFEVNETYFEGQNSFLQYRIAQVNEKLVIFAALIGVEDHDDCMSVS